MLYNTIVHFKNISFVKDDHWFVKYYCMYVCMISHDKTVDNLCNIFRCNWNWSWWGCIKKFYFFIQWLSNSYRILQLSSIHWHTGCFWTLITQSISRKCSFYKKATGTKIGKKNYEVNKCERFLFWKVNMKLKLNTYIIIRVLLTP